jgi:hypothetical protein
MGVGSSYELFALILTGCSQGQMVRIYRQPGKCYFRKEWTFYLVCKMQDRKVLLKTSFL